MVFLIPFVEFESWLKSFNETIKIDRRYWHVKIREVNGDYYILERAGTKNIKVNEFKL